MDMLEADVDVEAEPIPCLYRDELNKLLQEWTLNHITKVDVEWEGAQYAFLFESAVYEQHICCTNHPPNDTAFMFSVPVPSSNEEWDNWMEHAMGVIYFIARDPTESTFTTTPTPTSALTSALTSAFSSTVASFSLATQPAWKTSVSVKKRGRIGMLGVQEKYVNTTLAHQCVMYAVLSILRYAKEHQLDAPEIHVIPCDCTISHLFWNSLFNHSFEYYSPFPVQTYPRHRLEDAYKRYVLNVTAFHTFLNSNTPLRVHCIQIRTHVKPKKQL